MACFLKSVCCIDDVTAVKKYLFGNEDELPTDEEVNAWNEDNWADDWGDLKSSGQEVTETENNWLQKCYVAFSSTYDLLVIAFGQKIILLTVMTSSGAISNSNNPRRYKIVNQHEVGDEPGEHITSILCIPLVSLKKTSHGSVDWSCVVVGFSSGFIRIYTENGDQLVSQLLHNSSVIEIKCRTKDTGMMRYNSPVDQPDEVTVLYEDAIILLEGFSLFQTLRACRSQVALAAASGGISIEPPPLSYKKWRLTGNQVAISSHISPGILTPNPFDQMRTASVLGGYQAEIRGSAPAMSCFVAAGSSPYAGFYYAIEGSAQPHLSHVALAVASKLKSALYNSASRWLAWGTGSSQESEQKPIPKVEVGSPLDIRCGMPDPLRHGDNIVLAPGAQLSTATLAATTDSFGRVILMDVSRAIAVRMWKGYRDAQVGFMRIFDDAHRNRRHEEKKKARRHALFLLIYAPRRGLLEIWTCINGPRVGAFNVGKNARLLCNGFGMLGVNTNTMCGTTSYTFQCCLLEANGMVKEVVIPFHLALSDANSKKARDMHLLKKLSLMLHSKKRIGEEAVKLLLEMRISAMVRQGLERLLRTKRIGVEAFRNCLSSVINRLKEGGALRKPENDLCKYCDAHLGLISLYESLHKINDNSGTISSRILTDVTNVDVMCTLLHLTRTEAEDGLSAISRLLSSRLARKVSFQEEETPCLDIAEFLDAFTIVESAEKDTEKEWHPILKTLTENMYLKFGSFIFRSSLFGTASPEDILFTINNSIELKPRTQLELIFKYWLCQSDLIANDLGNCLKNLYNFIDSSAKKWISLNDDEGVNSLWEWIRDEVCVTSDNCFATYTLALVARGVAISYNTEENKDEENDSDEEEWEKMHKEEVDESNPPTYQESCKERHDVKSGEWETLWVDVEKWNFFLSQIHDCTLINTAISFGRRKLPKTSSTSEEDNSEGKTVPTFNEQRKETVSVKDLLSNGPGYMAELVSHSLCQMDIPPVCIEKVEMDSESNTHPKLTDCQNDLISFLHSVLYVKFPYSLAPDCLHSHCFWELIVEWNKDPMVIQCLTNGIEHLKLVRGDVQARHGLALMAWKTFIAKKYIGLLKLIDKVGKAPKDRLCRKEIGVSDVLMPQFGQACTDLLQIIADSEQTPRNSSTTKHLMPMTAEDPWLDVEGKRSIMDIGRGHAGAHMGLVQHYMHASFILHATMQFLLRGVKPLSSLFDQRGKSCLGLDLATRDPALPSNDAIPLEVNKSRLQFLRKLVTAAVRQLVDVLKDDSKSYNSKMEVKDDLESWIETATSMASEFQVSREKVKLHVVEELFRNGLDNAGIEACMTVPDKEVLSSSLILIVGQRVAYILQEASTEDGLEMLTRMSPTLSTWIKSQDSSVLKRPDVPVRDTAALARYVLSMMSDKHSLCSIARSLEQLTSSLSTR